ncbi:MAG TPA: hypothetical protein DCM05_05895 [Elusimicrobia bacterium]|nr:hypothetical protein [Elusimicrobiota bacterium]
MTSWSLLLLLALPALAGEPLSGADSNLPRSAASSGGEKSASSSYKLSSTVGELVSSTSASAGNLLDAGARRVFHFPGAVTNLTGIEQIFLTSTTLQWTAPGYDGRLASLQAWSTYYVRVASFTAPDTYRYSYALSIAVSTKDTAPGLSVSTPVYNLISNTTYFSQLWTKDAGGNASYGSNRATFTTLAVAVSPVHAGADPFYLSESPNISGVFYTSASVRWAALPQQPPFVDSVTARGYVVQASTTNFGLLSPGGVIHSSAAYHVLASTLIVCEPPLMTNKLYYFRVGSLNHAGIPHYAHFGSTQTKLQPVDPLPAVPAFTDISSYSITANVDPNGNADFTLFVVEASTVEDYQAEAFTSSSTFNFFLSTGGLASNTTYWFRAYASTGGSNSSYVELGSTSTLTAPPASVTPAFHNLSSDGFSASWSANGNPLQVTTYSAVITTGAAYPNSNDYNVVLTTKPDGSPPTATYVSIEPNTTYYFFAAGVNHNSVPSSFEHVGTTATYANVPLELPGQTYQEMTPTALSALWDADGNPLQVTTFTVHLTTAQGFGAVDDQVVFDTVPAAGPMSSFTGLTGNTTYYLRVRAVNHASVYTDYTVFTETSTLAEAASALNFTAVYPAADALRLDWSGGANRLQSTYTVQTSTDQDFGYGAAVTTDSVLDVYLSSPTLSANTTHHFRVRAWNNNGVPSDYAYASTATLANPPLAASPLYPALFESSATVRWERNGNPVSITTYTVELNASSFFDPYEPDHADLSTAPAGALPAASFTGLSANTTYYLRIRSVNHNDVPSDWLIPTETATLAALPTGADVSEVFHSSLTLTWSPGSAAGWAVQASSTNFGAAGKVYLSSTTDDGATSLTVYNRADETLWPNTTFFLRLSALNHNEVPSSVLVSSRSTLADPVSNPSFRTNGLDGVYSTSITVTWTPLPSAAAAGSSRACEGYVLEAATADAWGYSDFSGDILSSSTLVYVVASQLRPSTLTVVDLNPGATYAFRIATLNHAGAAHYAQAGSTRTQITPFTWTGGGGTNWWYTTTNWNPNGVPSQGSPVTIALNNARVMVRITDPPISFSSVTLGKVDGSVAVNLDVATSTYKAGDLLIYKNAGLTLATTQLFLLTGDVTMLSGSSISHRPNTTLQNYAIDIKAGGTFDLQVGATVYAVGRGYAGGALNGGDGSGTGRGYGDINSNGGGSGAGHGGAGGSASSNVGGSVYDSRTDPVYAGSGGGGGDTSGAGGAGGGYVRVEAQTLRLDGLIQADGAPGGTGTGGNANAGAGGGGSGGGVNLLVDYFIGLGTITALGGTGGTDTDNGNDPGGGGGGGRVSIDVVSGGNTCDILVSTAGAASGGGTSNGGSGGTYSSTVSIPTPSFYAAYATSVSIRWTWTESASAKFYQVRSSTGGAGQSPLLAYGTTAYTEWELLSNTTYTRYVQVSACGNLEDSASNELATHAQAPDALEQSFTSVFMTSMTVAWAARPASPDAESSRGYVLEASSTDFNGEGTIHSSQTLNVLLSTLTIPGLDPNTTYYYRVASLNWASAWSTYTHLGATSTLSFPPNPAEETFLEVFETSATANWVAMPTEAQDASSKSASGYILEASSTDFGVFKPGGAVYSSMTFNLALSTLTVGWAEALDYCTTYYFRVGALNHNASPNYRALGSTPTLIDHGAAFLTKTLNIGNVDVNTDFLITTGLVVKNLGTCPTSYSIKAATVTTDSPWVISTSSGTDEFTLQAGFNAAQPGADDFGEEDKLSDSPQDCTAARFALGQNGLGFTAKEERTLWFKIGMPKISGTDLGQDIQVTLISQPASP